VSAHTITKDTAARIAFAYSEIEAGEALLETIAKGREQREAPDFRDAFGRRRNLQLGVPNSANGHRLLDVEYSLAEIIIKTHIEKKRAEIEALTTLAVQEARRYERPDKLVEAAEGLLKRFQEVAGKAHIGHTFPEEECVRSAISDYRVKGEAP
jgi:hypothetical protein